MEPTIMKRDAALYTDISCCGCGRSVNLPNAIREGGHYYCPHCPGHQQPR